MKTSAVNCNIEIDVALMSHDFCRILHHFQHLCLKWDMFISIAPE